MILDVSGNEGVWSKEITLLKYWYSLVVLVVHEP